MGKRVIIVGIPGVGKTTVIEKLVEVAKAQALKVEHVIYGSIMLEDAKALGVEDRDFIRRLPVEEQRALQLRAARRIAGRRADLLLIDTHLFIRTPEGFYPGLPEAVVRILDPTHLALVEATPDEVLARRSKDRERRRDEASREEVELELNLARQMLGSLSVLTGAPMIIVKNEEGRAYEAAQRLLGALEVVR